MQKLKFEYRITAAYIVVGGVWILFSDKLLNFFVKDPDLLTRLQTYKGWFYVIITATLFYTFLKRHLAKIRYAEQKAKESDMLKTAFIQNISHEIRTPMNGIIGFTELLGSIDLSDTEKNEYLLMIRESSDQLLSIVNEVLDISMIESGSIKINKKEFFLNNLLEELYLSFKPLIKKNISFLLKKGLPDPSSLINTDDIKIRQVLSNLLSNAFKFTDKGHVNFGYSIKGNYLEFFVEDSGIGIEADSLDKIFERFQKAESETIRFYDGVGLGLAICKGIVDILRGKIWIKSEPGNGSTIFFTIPYEPVNPSLVKIEEKKNQKHEFKKITILIAEDDKPNYLYLKEIFKDSGIDIVHAVNGKEAIEICQTNDNISIILMDLKMPVINGYEATKQIKKIRPDLSVIAQSAFALSDERAKAFDAGCIDYISKPFKKDQLLSLIAKYQ